jgi:5'-deoxynucleotidase YfbR-like HD superfamily hydrolase
MRRLNSAKSALTLQDRDPAISRVEREVDLILWSIKLHNVRRYFHQRFWEEETRASEFATRIEPLPRLESVSEHSWHIGYIANLIAPRFEDLDLKTVLQHCILHDLLEIMMGDQSPIGRDGTGATTHAFNEDIAKNRSLSEEKVIAEYEALLPPELARDQGLLLRDYVYARTSEARFVKSVDKLQTLAFVIGKKAGEMHDKHIHFTLRYSEKGISYFPDLAPHFRELQHRLIETIAKRRAISRRELQERLFGRQLSFWS